MKLFPNDRGMTNEQHMGWGEGGGGGGYSRCSRACPMSQYWIRVLHQPLHIPQLPNYIKPNKYVYETVWRVPGESILHKNYKSVFVHPEVTDIHQTKEAGLRNSLKGSGSSRYFSGFALHGLPAEQCPEGVSVARTHGVVDHEVEGGVDVGGDVDDPQTRHGQVVVPSPSVHLRHERQDEPATRERSKDRRHRCMHSVAIRQSSDWDSVAIRQSSDWDSVAIRQSSDWHSVAIRQSSDWHSVAIRQSSDWHSVAIRQSSDWDSVAIRQSSDWHSVAKRQSSDWDSVAIRQSSDWDLFNTLH